MSHKRLKRISAASEDATVHSITLKNKKYCQRLINPDKSTHHMSASKETARGFSESTPSTHSCNLIPIIIAELYEKDSM